MNRAKALSWQGAPVPMPVFTPSSSIEHLLGVPPAQAAPSLQVPQMLLLGFSDSSERVGVTVSLLPGGGLSWNLAEYKGY